MLRVVMIVALSALLVPSLAEAGKKAPKGGKAAKAKKGKGKGKAAMPPVVKPAEQMSQFKSMLGKWRCKGKFHGMGPWPAHDYQATVKTKMVLGGHWMRLEWAQKKTRKRKNPMRAVAMIGYDAANSRFRVSGFDSFSGSSWGRSPGFQGNKWVEQGKARMGKHVSDTRMTMTKTGKRSYTVVNEVKIGNSWKTIAEESCKR